MKKLIFATAMFLGFSAMVFAQTPKEKLQNSTPEQRAEKMTAGMTKQLTLTEDQKTKVYAINLERAKQMESLKKESDLKGSKANVRDSFKSSDEQIVALLNEDQKKQYADMKAKRMENMKGQKGKKGGLREKRAK